MAAAMKLGELLVQEGVITSHQLEEALKYQVIFGGKLGTNLIELDFVREDDIAKTLSRMLRVPIVSGEELYNIPQDIINVIPRDIAEQYQVVPIHLEHRKLTLVMANPSDLKAIDEISFRTGYIIRPAVAAEVRLILALEKFYHIPREIRYVQVSKKVEASLSDDSSEKIKNTIMHEEVPAESAQNMQQNEAARKRKEAEARAAAEIKKKAEAQDKAEAQKQAAAKAKAKTKAETEILEEIEEIEEIKETPKPAPAVKSASRIRFEDDDDEDEVELPKAATPAKAAPAPAPKPAPAPTAKIEEVVDLAEADIVEEGADNIDAFPIEAVFKHLADPADREDIAESLAKHLGQDVDRAALFQIRGNVVIGWKLMVNNKPKNDFGAFQVTLDHPSILKTITDSASYYIGPIPKTSPDNMRMVETMGGNPPATVLLVPVIVMGRVVTVIYIDDKKADLPAKLLELQKLAGKMAMAFEILILKNKILMM